MLQCLSNKRFEVQIYLWYRATGTKSNSNKDNHEFQHHGEQTYPAKYNIQQSSPENNRSDQSLSKRENNNYTRIISYGLNCRWKASAPINARFDQMVYELQNILYYNSQYIITSLLTKKSLFSYRIQVLRGNHMGRSFSLLCSKFPEVLMADFITMFCCKLNMLYCRTLGRDSTSTDYSVL